jgi:hypothetical protein
MKPWQREALSVIRKARTHAIETSDENLHLACSRTIEAMVMEGGQVPRDLRQYAFQTLQRFESKVTEQAIAG